MKFAFLLLILIGPKLFASVQVSNFKKTMQYFLDHSNSLLTQQAMIESAQKRKLSESLYWTPKAQFNLSQPLPGADNEVYKGLSAQLNLNLWKFGADHKGYQASSARLRAENAKLEVTKQNFEMAVSGILFQLIRQNKIIDIRKKHLTLRIESVAVARERYKQGQLASQELEKVKIEFETSKIDLAEAELLKIDLQNSLKSLAEIEIDLNEWPFAGELNQQRKRKYRDLKDFFKVRASQADAEYYNLKSSEIWRESYLPSLNFTATWQQPDLNPIKQGEWSAFFGVTIPLWDQLSGSALAAQQAASARESELIYQQSIRETQAQLSNLSQRLELTKLNVQAALRAAEKLQELRNDSLRRFRMGRSTVNDLLLDENRFLEAESALLNSMLSYHELLVENCHAVDESILDCY